MMAAHVTSETATTTSNANYGSIYHYDDTYWRKVSPELHMSDAATTTPGSNNAMLINSGYSVLFVDAGYYFKLSVACEVVSVCGCDDFILSFVYMFDSMHILHPNHGRIISIL